MPSLTLEESRRRAALITVTSYDVQLDLTGDATTFLSTTRVSFRVDGTGDTFLDVRPVTLLSVHLNGDPLDVGTLSQGRLPLTEVTGNNELVVSAVMGYRNDGEGLHRSVDPADGRCYTYAMSFLDAAPTIYGCFDQPDLKAPYTLHVATPPDWVVVGNGRAEQVEPGRWELATTQPLSTYFVTLVAGPYHVVRGQHDGIELGLECRASMARHLDREAEEILTVTAQSFDELHRLFGIRYAFGDYHQAFVPEFNAGAMENPGCVTFRDSMVFPTAVTRSERTRRAATIAHEMAHQWFGNLVTMRWWDDLWLNESFAEYVGNRVTAEATDFRDVWVDSAFTVKRWGVVADQRPSTHPVAGNGAKDALSALQDFDGISYAKGSAVLKQLNARVGEQVFFDGVRDHLTRHRFGNATLHDLFDSWSRSGAGELDAWAAGWLRTPGLDLLRVDRTGAVPQIVREPPAEHPAERVHALSAAHASDGNGRWVQEPLVVSEPETPLPGVVGRPVVLDPGGDTWARFTLDDLTLAAMPELLPRMSDPLQRAAVWNAVWDGVLNALLDPELAMGLVEAGLPGESQDRAVTAISRFAVEQLAWRLLPREATLARISAAATARLSTAEPGSGVQLAATRVVVGSFARADADLLKRWLEGHHLPDGVQMDADLRWKILLRLAALGEVDRSGLQRWLEVEQTAETVVEHVRCLAALPDEEAKAYAWERFLGEVEASNYDVEAAGTGMWQPGQEQWTAPYVERFFADVPATAERRTGWLLADAAHAFYPSVAVEQGTVDAADAVLGDVSLDATLRRMLGDDTDDLRRLVKVRATFGLA